VFQGLPRAVWVVFCVPPPSYSKARRRAKSSLVSD
jgi:hypothetical protein